MELLITQSIMLRISILKGLRHIWILCKFGFDVFSSADEYVEWKLTPIQINWNIDGDRVNFARRKIISELREKALSPDAFELEIKIQAVFAARREVVILVVSDLHEGTGLLLDAAKVSTLGGNKLNRILTPVLDDLTVGIFAPNEDDD